MMINIENINKAMDVMERVQEHEINLNATLLDMRTWQANLYNPNSQDFFATEGEVLHNCGTVCCFAGWLAVSPEFQEMGVRPTTNSGRPYVEENRYEEVEVLLSRLFGVPIAEVGDLIYTTGDYRDVETVEDVINVLKAWRDSK